MEGKTNIVPGGKAIHVLSFFIKAIGTVAIYIGASAFILLSCAVDTDGEAFYMILQLIIASAAVIALGILIRRIGIRMKEDLPWMKK